MKKNIYTIIFMIFSSIIYSQSPLKEVIERHDNDNPKIIRYLNEELKVFLVEEFDENKNLIGFFNFDTVSGKLHGEFKKTIFKGKNLIYVNQGFYNQGLMSCKKFHNVFENHMVVGEIVSDVPIGHHQVKKLIQSSSKKIDQGGSRALSNKLNQNINYYVNVATGIFTEEISHLIIFDQSGFIKDLISFYDYEKNLVEIYYESGKIIGYKIFDDKSNLKDSVFQNSKLFKFEELFEKSPLRLDIIYNPISDPFNFKRNLLNPYKNPENKKITKEYKFSNVTLESIEIFERYLTDLNKNRDYYDSINRIYKSVNLDWVHDVEYNIEKFKLDYYVNNNCDGNDNLYNYLVKKFNFQTNKSQNNINESKDNIINCKITNSIKELIRIYFSNIHLNKEECSQQIFWKLKRLDIPMPKSKCSSDSYSIKEIEDFLILIFLDNNSPFKDVKFEVEVENSFKMFSIKEFILKVIIPKKNEEERKLKEKEERLEKELEIKIKQSKLNSRTDKEHLIKHVNKCYNYFSVIKNVSELGIFAPLGKKTSQNNNYVYALPNYHNDKLAKKSKIYESVYKKLIFGLEIQGSQITSQDTSRFLKSRYFKYYDEAIDSKDYIYVTRNPYLDLPSHKSEFVFFEYSNNAVKVLSDGLLSDNNILIPYIVGIKPEQDLIYGLNRKKIKMGSIFYVIHSPNDNKNIGILNPSLSELENILKFGLSAKNEKGFKLGTKLDDKNGWGVVIN